MTCGVYQITNTANGKRYIGSSYNITKRWINHRLELDTGIHHNRHLQNAWDKYDKSVWQWSILEKCEKENLIIREQSYLPPEKTYRALKKNGFYNESPIAGTRAGKKESEEVRRKKSERAKIQFGTDEDRRKMSERMKGKLPVFGYKHTEEFKRHKSEQMRGNHNAQGKRSEKTRQKMSESAMRRSEETRRKYSESAKRRHAREREQQQSRCFQ